MIMNRNKPIKILILGYTETGKSSYLKAIDDIKSNTGPEGFTLVSDPLKTDHISNFDGKASTRGIKHCRRKLRKSDRDVLTIRLTDIEGQAIESGSKSESSKKILSYISNECDSLILMVIAPTNPDASKIAKDQLHQLLNISTLALRKKSLPISLLINKIDKLQELQELSLLIQNDEEKSIKDFYKSGSIEQMYEQMNQFRRDRIYEKIQSSIFKTEVYEIIRDFEIFVQNSSRKFPNRIFLTSNVGFYKKRSEAVPFGCMPSFLWTLYAILKTKKSSLSQFGLVKKILFYLGFPDADQLANLLIKDIQYFHTSGNSYYDESSDRWSLKNF